MTAREDTVLKIISGENYTPCGLAEKLGARVVLESSSYMKGKSRHSLLMIDEAFRLIQNNDVITLEKKDSPPLVLQIDGDILDASSYFASQHKALEFPFPAGGIGFLAFEFVKNCDKVKFRLRNGEEGKADAAFPDAALLFGHVFLVFDHYTDLIYLLGINYEGHEIDLPGRIEAVEKRIRDMDFNYLVERNEKYECSVVYNPGPEKFMDSVLKVKEEIRIGNLLQCVISRKMKIRTDMPAFRAYKKLRSATPSPYMFFLDFTDFQLFGSSPEVHLLVTDGKAVMRPIAGTRRRGKTTDEDLLLEKELLEDDKEGAEHLMLVDLARNDLGRVCRAGSVRVTEARVIERYSHVMHIVSQVEGDLDNNGKIDAGATGFLKDPGQVQSPAVLRSLQALRAGFPAGTVSGAPKLKAIEILDRLEDEGRGFYAGIVGYFEPGGNLNTCINIRSGMKKGNIMTLQSGAGIVADSVPEREYEETCEKMRSIAKVIGLEV